MLTLTILGSEYFDESSQEFCYPQSYNLELEHSLVSLSKWEAEFEKPFLGKDEKTDDEALGYVYHMIVTPDIPRSITDRLTPEHILAVNDYINKKMTATWFNETNVNKRSSEIITSELIYWWMSEFNIPLECQTWHLNRLFTRIQISSVKMQKPKKLSTSERQDQAAKMRALNEQRRAEAQSRG